jgi:hypothetical protein
MSTDKEALQKIAQCILQSTKTNIKVATVSEEKTAMR